jgi:crotonobetainyl-CoA:carnitine CoA-transferase CaiB-like acyl-CoA transferase
VLIAGLRTKTTAEWLSEFDAIGLPCGPLNDIPHAAEQAQVKAREMLVDVEHPSGVSLRIANSPLRLGRTPGGIKGPPPVLGADTDDVLRRLIGLSDEDIGRLRADEVVFGPLPGPVERILEYERSLESREPDEGAGS